MASIAAVPARRRLALPQSAVLVGLVGASASVLSVYLVVFGLNSLNHWNDFVTEAWVPYQVLAKGEALRFLQSGPAYYGSLILRAPLGLLGTALSSRWGLPYVLSAAPCVVSAPLLGAWLTSERGPAAAAATWSRWLSPLGLLLVINPVFAYCIALGHPEDVLSAVLAITAVIFAARAKPAPAMVLVALAAFDKPWALVAIPVAFVVLPDRHLRAASVLSVSLAVLFVPTTLLRTDVGSAAGSLGSGTGGIFYPQQLWWWFGGNSWFSVHAHELIMVAGAVCAGVWWAAHGRRIRDPACRLREGLLLLALVLLLRAVMDPWNNLYYELPFLMVLYTIYAERPTVHLLVVTGVLFILTSPLSSIIGAWGSQADFYAGAYQLVTVPMIILFGLRLFAPAAAWARARATLGSLLPAPAELGGPDRR